MSAPAVCQAVRRGVTFNLALQGVRGLQNSLLLRNRRTSPIIVELALRGYDLSRLQGEETTSEIVKIG